MTRARKSPTGGRTRSRRLIIAIDGPAGSGKSTVAKIVAKKLKLPYIDTGAMYRAVTLKAINEGIDLKNTKALVVAAKNAKISFKNIVGAPLVGAQKRAGTSPAPTQRVYLDGHDVTKEIRTPELTRNVVYVAREPLCRREMVKKQKALGKKSGAVMEGRDIGTMVFPGADFKFYLEADPRVRARRRYLELKAGGKKVGYAEVLKDLVYRDKTDKTRKEGPLRVAKDAFLLDTTSLTINQVVDRILTRVGK